MALPSYILCSQSGVEDKFTGFVSCFHIIERIRFSKNPLPQGQIPMSQMWMCAAWLREEEDRDKEFEFENRILLPDGNSMDGTKGTFTFAGDIQHITLLLFGGLPLNQSGIMRIQNSIRRVDAESWLSQEYRISIEEILPSVAPAEERQGA